MCEEGIFVKSVARFQIPPPPKKKDERVKYLKYFSICFVAVDFYQQMYFVGRTD